MQRLAPTAGAGYSVHAALVQVRINLYRPILRNSTLCVSCVLQALNANLRLQLLRLACSRTTPGRLASGAVMACAAALLDAAASRLAAPPSAAADQPPAASGLGGGAARAAGAADGAQCREALGLLRDALACLEQLLEGEADGDGDAISEASADEEWGGAGGRAAGGDGGSKGSRFTEVEVMEVCAMRQQVRRCRAGCLAAVVPLWLVSLAVAYAATAQLGTRRKTGVYDFRLPDAGVQAHHQHLQPQQGPRGGPVVRP